MPHPAADQIHLIYWMTVFMPDKISKIDKNYSTHTETMVFVILLSIFALAPVPICAHSRTLPHTPARADARISMGEWQKSRQLQPLALFFLSTCSSSTAAMTSPIHPPQQWPLQFIHHSNDLSNSSTTAMTLPQRLVEVWCLTTSEPAWAWKFHWIKSCLLLRSL